MAGLCVAFRGDHGDSEERSKGLKNRVCYVIRVKTTAGGRLMNLIAILSNIGIPDILDILFISVVAYQFYVWFWGTQAFKALLGIVVLSGIYIVASSWGLFLTTWVFQILWQVFVILLIILFQKEIRQMLVRFNPLKSIGFKHQAQPDAWFSEIVDWSFDAAQKKVGAIIIFERKDLVFDLVTKGIAMESAPKSEILWAIFSKDSPLHDGAALISNGTIVKTACFLPLTVAEDLPKKWGTRHRAALGLTEQCDAVALTISEERGDISLIMGDDHRTIQDKDELSARLATLFDDEKDESKDMKERFVSWFTRRYKIKATIFALVFVLWLALAGQQNFEKKIIVPLRYKNLDTSLVVEGATNQGVSITCRGLRKDVSRLSKDNISAVIDLMSAVPGSFSYPLTTGNVTLPNDRIHLVNIRPLRIELVIKKGP